MISLWGYQLPKITNELKTSGSWFKYVFLCENKTNHKSYCLGKKHITLNETIYFFNAILGQQQLRTAVNAPAAGKHD